MFFDTFIIDPYIVPKEHDLFIYSQIYIIIKLIIEALVTIFILIFVLYTSFMYGYTMYYYYEEMYKGWNNIRNSLALTGIIAAFISITCLIILRFRFNKKLVERYIFSSKGMVDIHVPDHFAL